MKDLIKARQLDAGPLFAAAERTLPLARTNDPETSRKAAQSLDAATMRDQLAQAFRLAGWHGMTDEEAGAATGIPGGWKRCSDLRRLGLIEPTGSTRRGSSGREQRVSRWTGGAR